MGYINRKINNKVYLSKWVEPVSEIYVTDCNVYAPEISDIKIREWGEF